MLSLFFSFSSYARQWKKIDIPNAYCGNGKQYSVYLDLKNSLKLSIELMGGGACFDYESCFGPRFKTLLFKIPKLPAFSVLSAGHKKFSVLHDQNYLYFPYCNGDVFAGNHTATYKKNNGNKIKTVFSSWKTKFSFDS